MNDRRDDPAATEQQTGAVRGETPQRALDDRANVSDVRDTADANDTDAGFLPQDRMDDLRTRWSEVQVSFVDDPRSAVQQAHDLVTRIVNDLTDTFTRERSTLESQWSGGGEADTEALRVALQRYRSFFNRLLGTTGAQ